MKYLVNIIFLLSFGFVLKGQESATIEGTIKIGHYDLTSPEPTAGTIQWTGNDLVGFNDSKWVSLTTGVAYDGFVEDEDGNTYFTIKIGSQEWMAENLRTTKYNDGLDIDHITASNSWGKTNLSDQGAYCWYDNDIEHADVYGALYNWYAVNTGKLCPSGWHVATDSDWDVLSSFLGGDGDAGGKLKAEFEIHWQAPNNNATNEVGFTAQPAGIRNLDTGAFIYEALNILTTYWSSSSASTDNAYYRAMLNLFDFLDDDDVDKRIGMSVRCIKN